MDDLKLDAQNNQIDKLISKAKNINAENLQEAIQIYEDYYNKELNITKSIHMILLKVEKAKIPNEGLIDIELLQ